jgi:hypothetical protein
MKHQHLRFARQTLRVVGGVESEQLLQQPLLQHFVHTPVQVVVQHALQRKLCQGLHKALFVNKQNFLNGVKFKIHQFRF